MINVLVVEDDAMSAKITEFFLVEFNCKVDLASNGKSALALADRYNYDLIFMDIGLPNFMDDEVAQQIREGKRSLNKETPIIALSAHIQPQHKETYLQSGMQAILIKTLTRKPVIEVLKTFVIQK